MNEADRAALSALVGPGNLSTAPEDLLSYARDLWPRGLLLTQGGHAPSVTPGAVAWPESTAALQALVRECRARGLSFVPYGAGSGVCGGAVPLRPGLSIDTKRMRRILWTDAKAGLARVECGIIGEVLERALNRRGLTLGHFPSSIYCSTLGGFLAARSAGQLSTRYGKIEDMVTSAEVVLASGEAVEVGLGRPDWLQALVGAEGTLGFFTQATLRVHPVAEARRLRGVKFRTPEEGLEAIRAMLQAGIRPAVVRLYDELDTLIALAGKGKAAPAESEFAGSEYATKSAGVSSAEGHAAHANSTRGTRPGLAGLATEAREAQSKNTTHENTAQNAPTESARHENTAQVSSAEAYANATRGTQPGHESSGAASRVSSAEGHAAHANTTRGTQPGLAGHENTTRGIQPGLATEAREAKPGSVGYESSTREAKPGSAGHESNTREAKPGSVGYEGQTREAKPGSVGYEGQTREAKPGSVGYEGQTREAKSRSARDVRRPLGAALAALVRRLPQDRLARAASSYLFRLAPALGRLAEIGPRLAGAGCLLILAFEGRADLAHAEEKEALSIAAQFGAQDLGTAPGERWLSRRYAVSYNLSKVFQAGAFADTFEVVTSWDRLGELYRAVHAALSAECFVMAHFSHAYHEGCSIYFTFSSSAATFEEALARYQRTWNRALDAALLCGSASSHHHGIGSLKAAHLRRELGAGGLLLDGLKQALDPEHLSNPGKLGFPLSAPTEPA
jgi:FAD/FMN-containing dehydrogenase